MRHVGELLSESFQNDGFDFSFVEFHTLVLVQYPNSLGLPVCHHYKRQKQCPQNSGHSGKNNLWHPSAWAYTWLCVF